MSGTKDLRWKKISQKDRQINRFFSIRTVRFRLPTGATGNFYLKKVGRLTAALVLTKEKKIVLVQQFRPGPERVHWELPGGRIENHETPRQAIVREVLEESGYKGKIRRLGESTNNVYSTLMRTHFVITDAIKIAEPNYDEFEYGRVCLVSLRQFRQLLRKGMMSDVETGYLGLDALGLL